MGSEHDKGERKWWVWRSRNGSQGVDYQSVGQCGERSKLYATLGAREESLEINNLAGHLERAQHGQLAEG